MLIFFIHWRHDLDSDEGLVLAGAWNIYNNQKLYLDFFSYKMPGSFYAMAWLFKIFSPNYYIANLFAILLLFFSAIGIYKIGRFFLKKNLSLVPAVIYIASSSYWPLINHNFFSIFLIIWSLYFFLLGTKRKKYYLFIISGLFTGISILFLQHKGLAFFAAILSLLAINYIKNKKSDIIKQAVLFTAGAIAPLSLLFIFWPIKLLYNNLILFPLLHYIKANRVSYNLLFFFFTIWLLIYPQIKKRNKDLLFALWYIQLFLFISIYPRPGKFHLYSVIFPFYIIMMLIIRDLAASQDQKPRKSLIFSAAAALTLFITSESFLFLFFTTPNAKQIIQMVNRNCRESKYIYSGPFMPGIYFESKKFNPSPYSSLITNIHTKNQFLQAKQALVKYHPECAVLNYRIVKKFNYNMDNPLDNYIKNNYTLLDSRGTTELYKLTQN